MAVYRSRSTLPPVVDFTPPVDVTEVDAATLAARDQYELVRLADSDLSGVDLSSTTFLECELASVSLGDAQLRGARFVDTLLTASFAPVFLAARSSWRRCRIENPRWGSAELFDADLDSVHLRGGKIDFLNLRGARMTNVLIEGCTITELDLGGFSGTRVALKDCRIETLDVTRSRCTDVDLRSSEFGRINGIEGLAGATIDDVQLTQFAPALASHLGLRVE
jgi:uncharacterized protein YjbI with pentapeptide repeats